jgi:CubicO group peptidase (beta-lactamase class C family)
MLQRGSWKGEQLIDASFIDEATRPGSALSPRCGLLWWLIPESRRFVLDDAHLASMRAAGVDTALVDKLAAIKGEWTETAPLVDALRRTFGADLEKALDTIRARTPGADVVKSESSGPIIGYEANGYLGQYAVVYPAKGLVAVRMIRQEDRYDENTDSFDTFQQLVAKLAR